MKILNKKNISQNIQAVDIARKAGLKYQDAGLICQIASGIQKHNQYQDDSSGGGETL